MDMLDPSRTAVAALKALHVDHDVAKATELTDMMAREGKMGEYTACMQALAMTLLGALDRTEPLTGVGAEDLLNHLSSKMAASDGIEI